MLDLERQSELFPMFSQDLKFPTYLVPFLPKIGSLGKELDAPVLEMLQVAPGSPNVEVKSPFAGLNGIECGLNLVISQPYTLVRFS